MKNRKIYFIAIIVIALFGWSFMNINNPNSSKFSYEVSAKNGGENGFSNSTCKLNTLTGINTYNLSEPGNEKYNHCGFSDFNNNVQKLILSVDDLIDNNVKTDGELKEGKYKATYHITDKYNFDYIIISE